MSFKKIFYVSLLMFLLFLMFSTGRASAEEECLSPEDKKIFMNMYADIVEKGQTYKVEEVKQFLKTHGCAKEWEEAERQAQEIVKGSTK